MAARSRIVWTDVALEDLDAAVGRVASASPAAGERLVARLERAIGSLAMFPMSGGPIQNQQIPGLREVILAPFRLVYRLHRGDVHIIGFVHSARDFDRWLQQRETEA